MPASATAMALRAVMPAKGTTTRGNAAAPPSPKYGVSLAPPAWVNLTTAEREVFDALCGSLPADIHREIDAGQISELARVIIAMERARGHIAKHGSLEKITLINGSERTRESAQFKVLGALAKQRHKLLKDLGLDVSARVRLAPGTKTATESASGRWS